MNKKPIEQAKNSLLGKALPALERAALRAQKIAKQTGTSVIVIQDGELQKIQPDAIHESNAVYKKGQDE